MPKRDGLVRVGAKHRKAFAVRVAARVDEPLAKVPDVLLAVARRVAQSCGVTEPRVVHLRSALLHPFVKSNEAWVPSSL
jgi:hypothetical protein